MRAPLLAGVVLGMCVASWGGATSIRVHGVVFDEKGKKLPGCSVVVFSAKQPVTDINHRSVDGAYDFKVSAVGQIEVRYSAPSHYGVRIANLKGDRDQRIHSVLHHFGTLDKEAKVVALSSIQTAFIVDGFGDTKDLETRYRMMFGEGKVPKPERATLDLMGRFLDMCRRLK